MEDKKNRKAKQSLLKLVGLMSESELNELEKNIAENKVRFRKSLDNRIKL